MKEGEKSRDTSVITQTKDNLVLFDEQYLLPEQRDHLFAMQCNGHFFNRRCEWVYVPEAVKPFEKEFVNQQVMFYGPNQKGDFFKGSPDFYQLLHRAFSRPPVTSAVRKYREISDHQAARISYIFGGIVRHLGGLQAKGYPIDNDYIEEAVEFTARMTMLGGKKSGEAIAAAMGMYVISDGPIEKDNCFTGNVYRMAEAIEEDPVVPLETRDLGLSQVSRLRSFIEKNAGKNNWSLPDLPEFDNELKDLPTVGAEFHFPDNAWENYPNFWQRLVIFNMSQYQKDSYIQFCRDDQGVIEVRMNPSVYPVTIANWRHLRFLMPELGRTYFTATINRASDDDFYWSQQGQKKILDSLRSVGMLSYAVLYEDLPPTSSRAEINFGQVYLGQTMRVCQGKYQFSGNWEGNEDKGHGQMSIYAGWGDNFPYLMYYPSMVLHEPSILNSDDKHFLTQAHTLYKAIAVGSGKRNQFFETMQKRIREDEKLGMIAVAGDGVMKRLCI